MLCELPSPLHPYQVCDPIGERRGRRIGQLKERRKEERRAESSFQEVLPLLRSGTYL